MPCYVMLVLSNVRSTQTNDQIFVDNEIWTGEQPQKTATCIHYVYAVVETEKNTTMFG